MAVLEMAHGLIQVYRKGGTVPVAVYSNAQRRTGRAILETAGWEVVRGCDWELELPNSFRLRVRR